MFASLLLHPKQTSVYTPIISESVMDYGNQYRNFQIINPSIYSTASWFLYYKKNCGVFNRSSKSIEINTCTQQIRILIIVQCMVEKIHALLFANKMYLRLLKTKNVHDILHFLRRQYLSFYTHRHSNSLGIEQTRQINLIFFFLIQICVY